MVKILSTFVALAPFLGTALADSWGQAFSLGPTTGAVVGTSYTFTSGTPPSPPEEYDLVQLTIVCDAERVHSYVFLWVGISNATSGLIQAGTNQYSNQKAALVFLLFSYRCNGGLIEADAAPRTPSGALVRATLGTLICKFHTFCLIDACSVVNGVTQQVDGPMVPVNGSTPVNVAYTVILPSLLVVSELNREPPI